MYESVFADKLNKNGVKVIGEDDNLYEPRQLEVGKARKSKPKETLNDVSDLFLERKVGNKQ